MGNNEMKIYGMLVSLIVPMDNHIANGGENILGNASSIKMRPDGRVYISGQKQRHALFSAIDRLNRQSSEKNETYISNGDGVSSIIERDIRADLGGFLHTEKDSYSGRRTAPLTATPAVALNPSSIGRDLLIRLKLDIKGDQDQALATKEYSQADMMHMNFFLDIGSVSIRRAYNYENGTHIKTEYKKFCDELERLRRVKLVLRATGELLDYANNARNAVSGEPQKVLIVFDTKLSRKASRYFVSDDVEKKRIIEELDLRKANYFIGDDTNSDLCSVARAYKSAMEFLENPINILFDPSNNSEIMTTEQFENAQS